ncbi:MAG: adenylyltransferase/cytidyltransferase family protein [Patescibacteria group bacterium]
MVKVLAFGVFDGFHEGHKFFLREAKKLGDFLVVVVTPDEVVELIKKKLPRFNLGKRLKEIQDSKLADEVVVGDKLLEGWEILQKTNPEIIAIGYDQNDLESSLKNHLKSEKLFITLKTIPPLEETKYKSSLINN